MGSPPYNSYVMYFVPGSFSSIVGWQIGFTDASYTELSLPAFSVSPNAWNHVVGTYDGSTMALYFNGVLASSTSVSKTIDYGTNIPSGYNLALTGGSLTGSSPGSLMAAGGSTIGMDETRISNVARNSDWIATEYNNQSSPATFVTMGMERTTPYSYRRTFIIDHTKVPNTDQINFPVLISTTIASWLLSPMAGTSRTRADSTWSGRLGATAPIF